MNRNLECCDMAIRPRNVYTLSHGERKERLFQLSKGLSHPARVEIINILATVPPAKRCICGDIVNALPLAQSSVSQHLKILKETGWIQGEISGPRVYYCLVHGIIEHFQALLHLTLESTNTTKEKIHV